MKLDEMRSYNEKELYSKVSELKEELFRLKLKLTTGELEDTSKISKIKKDISRMKTIITEKSKEPNNGK
jgi:large subunit ribosomal protein L29